MQYYDLGPYSRQVTTASADAQLWFDRGRNRTARVWHGWSSARTQAGGPVRTSRRAPDPASYNFV